MKVKAKRSSIKLQLVLRTASSLCSLFFLAGFYGSTFLFQPKLRMLQVVEKENAHPNSETGDASLESIPFQVLSWQLQALYFPNFATAEQCQSIIEMAKKHLKPSQLALRPGETAETTKGTRTSSGTFISASEDKTGTLDLIEQKIARATMLPHTHGEAFNVLRYEVGQKYDSHYDAFNPAEPGPLSSQKVGFLLAVSI